MDTKFLEATSFEECPTCGNIKRKKGSIVFEVDQVYLMHPEILGLTSHRRVKLHILYVLPSILEGEQLIICKYWIKTNLAWHQEMFLDYELIAKIRQSQMYDSEQKNDS